MTPISVEEGLRKMKDSPLNIIKELSPLVGELLRNQKLSTSDHRNQSFLLGS